MIEIYTDGGCTGNPGPGGWGCLIRSGGEEQRLSGGAPDTTNNRMELTAVIRALEWLAAPEGGGRKAAVLHTDSQYVRNGITQWIKNWVRNGWKTAAKKPVKNRDLWQELKSLDDELEVEWRWVKGHAGNEGNEICDALVKAEMDKLIEKRG